MLYLPVGSDGAVYSPLESVVTARTRPVPVLVNVTVVPGITEPVESVMTPSMVPVTACAARATGSNSATTRHRTALFTFVLHGPPKRHRTNRPPHPRIQDRWKSPMRPSSPPPRVYCRPADAAAAAPDRRR